MDISPALERKLADNAEFENKNGKPNLPPTISEVLASPNFLPRTTYPTGILALDELIVGGLRSRQFSQLCAPTGDGKTGAVGTIALSIAARGTPVLWCLTELDAFEQAARFAAINAHLRGLSITPDDVLSLRASPQVAAQQLADLPVYLCDIDESGDPFAEIAVAATNIANATGKSPVVIIDYVQAMPAGSDENKHASLSEIAKQCRRLARNLDVHVLGISSVSRAYYGPAARARKKAKAEELDDPRFYLAAAKESGDIEFACANVFYLDTADEMTVCGERLARLAVAKARGGRVGFVGLRFHGPSGHFTEAPEALSVLRAAAAQTGPSDEERVLKYLRSNVTKDITREHVRSSAGLAARRADDAVRILEAERKIEVVSIDFENARGQTRQKKIIRLVDSE